MSVHKTNWFPYLNSVAEVKTLIHMDDGNKKLNDFCLFVVEYADGYNPVKPIDYFSSFNRLSLSWEHKCLKESKSECFLLFSNKKYLVPFNFFSKAKAYNKGAPLKFKGIIDYIILHQFENCYGVHICMLFNGVNFGLHLNFNVDLMLFSLGKTWCSYGYGIPSYYEAKDGKDIKLTDIINKPVEFSNGCTFYLGK